MSRYGQRLGLDSDDVWNLGTVTLAAGLLCARGWNVVEYWGIYATEPLLIFSLRPSGFALWPGIMAAIIIGYAYMVRKALDPARVLASVLIGCVTAGIVLNLAAFLTGTTVGTLAAPDMIPSGLQHYGEPRHPVALYQMLGLLLILSWVWFIADKTRAGRLILLVALFYALLRLGIDAFRAETALIGSLRLSQIVAFVAALTLCLWLARTEPRAEKQDPSRQLADRDIAERDIRS